MPTHLTTWDWLFDSPYSPLSRLGRDQLAGYTDATTNETLDWAAVKTLTTHLSTALVGKYGLRPGETVSLFSQNSVWYPVVMHGALRYGARVSGASPAYGVDEMAYALRTAKARLLVTGKESLGVAVKAAQKAGLERGRVVLLEGEAEGFETVSVRRDSKKGCAGDLHLGERIDRVGKGARREQSGPGIQDPRGQEER